ncbi:MAG: hypothetical protein IJ643_00545, partial [Eubacterium sp.]|nr:hypothetical protein [Eubacterium sp.]
ITTLKCPLGRQPKRTFVLCSDKKSADFRMQSSFDKVILVHKCITKFPTYSRMQGIFNAFRDKRTKSKPILRYRTSPNLGCTFLLHFTTIIKNINIGGKCNEKYITDEKTALMLY